MILRAGTRGSDLALRQTELVTKEIQKADPSVEVVPVILKTDGDRIQDRSLAEIGGKGLFVHTLEKALLNGEIDFAVHSGKDLPAVTADSFSVPATLQRATPWDCLISRTPNLTEGILGTSSPRRENRIGKLLPKAETKLLRGNVPSRIRKLRDGQYDGILLAMAGIERLNLDLSDLYVRPFSPVELVPASCQGIIAVETLRGSDAETVLSALDHKDSHRSFDLERRLMQLLGADCHDAVGVYSEAVNDATMHVTAFYRDSDVYESDITDEEDLLRLCRLLTEEDRAE